MDAYVLSWRTSDARGRAVECLAALPPSALTVAEWDIPFGERGLSAASGRLRRFGASTPSAAWMATGSLRCGVGCGLGGLDRRMPGGVRGEKPAVAPHARIGDVRPLGVRERTPNRHPRGL